MWCPDVDIVERNTTGALTSPSVISIKPEYQINHLSLFKNQFPEEVAKVKHLGVISTMWAQGQHKDFAAIWSLRDFVNLQTLIVRINWEKENEYAKDPLKGLSTTEGRKPNPSWQLPGDIEDHIEVIQAHYRQFGPAHMMSKEKIKVRVIEKDEDVLGMCSFRLNQ